MAVVPPESLGKGGRINQATTGFLKKNRDKFNKVRIFAPFIILAIEILSYLLLKTFPETYKDYFYPLLTQLNQFVFGVWVFLEIEFHTLFKPCRSKRLATSSLILYYLFGFIGVLTGLSGWIYYVVVTQMFFFVSLISFLWFLRSENKL